MRISDWSSDVCSSDLPQRRRDVAPGEIAEALMRDALLGRDHLIFLIPESVLTRPIELGTARRRNTGERDTGIAARNDRERSEERRVGKECDSTSRSWW